MHPQALAYIAISKYTVYSQQVQQYKAEKVAISDALPLKAA